MIHPSCFRELDTGSLAAAVNLTLTFGLALGEETHQSFSDTHCLRSSGVFIPSTTKQK